MYKPHTILISLFFLLLSACAPQNVKDDTSYDAKDLINLSSLANTAYNEERWSEAVSLYQKLTESVPNDSENWFRLGNSHARLGQHVNAANAYQQALIRDKDNAKVLHNMGITQLRLATYTFIELEGNTKTDNPLNKRAKEFINSISKLLDQNFQENPVIETDSGLNLKLSSPNTTR